MRNDFAQVIINQLSSSYNSIIVKNFGVEYSGQDMAPSLERYGRTLKRRVLASADEYVPLGLKLGDFSEFLRVDSQSEDEDDSGVDDVAQTIRVVENGSDTTRPSTAESLAGLVARRVLSEKMNREVRNSPARGTVVEMVVPLNSRVADESTVVNGLSLVNLAMNSDLVDDSSAHNVMASGIARLVEGLDDRTLMMSLFDALDMPTKCALVETVLRDETLMQQMRERAGLPPLVREPSLESQLAMLFRTAFSIWVLLYGKIMVPIMAKMWATALSVNRELQIADTAVKWGLYWLQILLALLLRVVLALTGAETAPGVLETPQLDRLARLVARKVRGGMARTERGV